MGYTLLAAVDNLQVKLCHIYQSLLVLDLYLLQLNCEVYFKTKDMASNYE